MKFSLPPKHEKYIGKVFGNLKGTKTKRSKYSSFADGHGQSQ